jgi:benzoyl-CoA reductase/2-hydroxyglutaryl-CoA dehydratase subunit BcrC/BadD/HgdB
LALVGGPLLESDRELLEAVENAGGRIVLDATEGGERTLPAPLDPERLEADPFDELVRVYFDSIPDVFRRPNDGLYDWLRQRIADRGVRGIIVRRHVWCDLWHAELPRLRQEMSLPLLDLDIAASDGGVMAAAAGRVEAFLEMLR